MIIGNWTHSQVCSIMLVKTTQYKSSGISSPNLLRALEIFDLPPAISPELNKCLGSNSVKEIIPIYIIPSSEIRLLLRLLKKSLSHHKIYILPNAFPDDSLRFYKTRITAYLSSVQICNTVSWMNEPYFRSIANYTSWWLYELVLSK